MHPGGDTKRPIITVQAPINGFYIVQTLDATLAIHSKIPINLPREVAVVQRPDERLTGGR